MSVFKDQATFMEACDQHFGVTRDINQSVMYRDLIDEESEELDMACTLKDKVDAGLDIIVVTIGYLLSEGVPAAVLEECWREVIGTNMAKIDPATGKVRKRADGKVLKPEGWKPPDLAAILERHGLKANEP
jgi:predicted HAD superfamily Cof-like phosphohydrolase